LLEVVLFVLAALLGGACAALSWGHERRVARLVLVDLMLLSRALQRLPPEARAEELRRKAPEGSWERDLAEELCASAGAEQQLAALNAALADAGHRLSAGAGWPSAATRIAVFGGALLGLLAYLSTSQLEWAAAATGVSGVSALACIEAGRRARRLARSRREGIDALAEAVAGHLEARPSGPRGESWRRRRQG
jgi:hypothetical protein